MKNLAIKLFAFLAFLPFLVPATVAMSQQEVARNPDGWTVVSTWRAGQWVSEREYRPDGTLYQHRYWDYSLRMNVVMYDQTGEDVVSHEKLQ